MTEEEIPTAAKVVEKDIDWEGWHGQDSIKDVGITDTDLVKDEDELVRRSDVLNLIDNVWMKVLDEYGQDADVAWGMKILARELKYRIDPEINAGVRENNSEGKNDT